MQTTLSTQKLGPLIAALSQNLMAISSILQEDAQTAAPVKEAEQEKIPESSQVIPEKDQAAEKKNPAIKDSSKGCLKETESPVTIPQIRAVLAEKSQAGLTEKVRELIQSYGVKKLSEISPEKYSEVLAAAKALK